MLQRLKVYTSNPLFNAQTMKSISKAAYGLYDFVKGAEFYATKLIEYNQSC